MTDQKFCIECGRNLNPTDRFCPECGAMLGDDRADVPAQEMSCCREPVHGNSGRSGLLRNVVVLSLLWGIIALVSGLYLFADCGAVAHTFVETLEGYEYTEGQSMWEYFVEEGFTEKDIETLYAALGLCLIASGVLALMASHLAHRRQRYRIAVVLLILSSLTSGFGLLTLVVGIIVTYYLTKCKYEFTS